MQNKHLTALVTGSLTQDVSVTLQLMNDWKAADAAGYEKAVLSMFSPEPAPAATTQELDRERAKFQQETRHTSELSQMLLRWIERHEAEHGPGPWARSCDVCALVGASRALIEKPINAPAADKGETR